MPPFLDVSVRFWYHVSPSDDGCWVWTGSKTKAGYGQININRRCQPAHRVAYQLCRGDVPRFSETGLVIMHSCDNRACVNPWHMSFGTMTDNFDDMRKKGRQRVTGIGGVCDKTGMCWNGLHEWKAENWVYQRARGSVWRICKHCRQAAKKASRDRIKARSQNA